MLIDVVLKSPIYICHSFSIYICFSVPPIAFVSHHSKLFSVMPSSTDFNLHIYTSTHAHALSWGHVAASWNSPLADPVSQMTLWKWPVLSSAASQLHTITCFNVPCNNLWAAHSVAFVPQPFFPCSVFIHLGSFASTSSYLAFCLVIQASSLVIMGSCRAEVLRVGS